jgi:FtsP/CotA-like multicopper oxidase with cupredoxin domain
MQFLQISNGGGLLPNPILRDKFEIWPAMRREVVIDFAHYQNGSSTSVGDKIFLVNTAKMPDGRMPTSIADAAYKVPMIMFVIDGDPPEADNSKPIATLAQQGQAAASQGQASLRAQPDVIVNGTPMPVAALFDKSGKPIPALQTMIDNRRQFTLQRGGNTNTAPGNSPNDNEWSINGHPFDETFNVLDQKGRPTEPKQGVPEVWEIINGGGGWVHPMHLHMEEHKVLMRNGRVAATWQANAMATDPRHSDDTGKDDVVLMDPSESVMVVRNFRTFRGKYVAHCHNLAHEDHAMMFGWEIK